MDGKKTFWDRVEEYPLWKLLSYVFLISLSERLIVTLVFFIRWGWHTVSGIELWFYYGVARGTFNLYSAWDPTWWILKVLGFVFNGQALLYSVYLTSSLSSSLNSALFCLLVSEIHDKKTGFLAGLIYGSMVLPMFNSAGTVTHDIFAYPYLVLSLYGVLMCFRSKGFFRPVFAVLCLVSLFLGLKVGPTILVSAGAIVLYLLWEAVGAVAGRKAVEENYTVFAVFLAVIIGLLVLVHYELMPPLMEKMFDLARETRGIDVRAQIKAGSGDLLASSFGDYWLRFNFLIFFLPVGLVVAFKKKDVMGFALIMVAFLASRAADRGTRPLTFGFALMGALAFVNWKTVYTWILAAWTVFIIGYFGNRYSLEYAVFFPVAAFFIYLSLQTPPRGARTSGCWFVFIIGLLWLAIGGTLGLVIFNAKRSGDGKLIKQVMSAWTVQECLLVALILFLIHAWQYRPLDKRDRRWINSSLEKIAYGAFIFIGALLLILQPKGFWTNIYLVLPVPVAAAVFVMVWPRRAEETRKFFTGVAAVCWLFATVIPSMNQTPKSTEAEYRVYEWLGKNLPPGGKIFVPWSDGYMAEAISGFTSELSPENIDFILPRAYWLPEGEAARFLRDKGLKYIVVSTKYFRLLRYNKANGDFQYSYSPDIIYQPQQAGITSMNQLQETTLFKLLYRTRELTKFRLLRVEKESDTPAAHLVYEILP